MEKRQGYGRLTGRPHRILVITMTMAGILLAINQYFNLQLYTGITIMGPAALYIMLAILLSLTFIIYPGSKKAQGHVPWYDIVLFILCIGACLYFASHVIDIITKGWEFAAPTEVFILATILFVLTMEAQRRAGGLLLFLVVLVISAYPMIAQYMPSLLFGFNLSFRETMLYYIMSGQGLVGLPIQTVVNLVMGFILLGVTLEATGGGKFFLNLAIAVVGRFRGGPAKVAIFASALFGSMSGSTVSNVVSTGSITIPTMKRIGYPPELAGAIETCASVGGVLTPPIMGAVAFLMASFLGIPYWQVALAAVIPSALYFFSLLMQIDGHAARIGLRGSPKEENPSIRTTLKEGWFFIFVLAVLVWLLVFLQREAQAPFYATALLLLLANVRKETRLSWHKLEQFVLTAGRLLVQVIAILAACGFFLAALVVSGVGVVLSGSLVQLAGGNSTLLLLMGALTAFLLGLPMSTSAVYIFLAVVLAPAMEQTGIPPLASHLFIMYWAVLSHITPPLAIPAYAAAAISGGNPLKTAMEAMRLGFVLYLVPFFFVYNPVLLCQDVTVANMTIALAKSVAGIIFIAAGYSGYLIGVGTIRLQGILNWLLRALMVIGGVFLAWPTPLLDILGLILMALTLAIALFAKQRAVQRTNQ
ncbi:TRAP transporter permease [Chloroflexota bacterium]